LELNILLQAGVTLADGVLMLWEDEPDTDGKAVLRSLLDTLEQGLPLSAALHESPYFPRYMVNMTDAGEKTGRLSETLKALAEHYERQERLAITVKNAVLYPAILLIMMVAVVMVLIIQVLPIFNDVFARLGSQMSPLALRLMQFGGWLSDVSAVIALVFALIIVAVLIAWLSPAARASFMQAFYNVWGGRGLPGSIASARFVSVISLAVASGIAAAEAVEMASSVSGGAKAADRKHQRCLDSLQEGRTLSEAMLDAGILSARNGRTLSLGDRNGMLDTAMAEIAARSERDVEDEIDRIISKVEPTLVVIASVIVGVILLSVMLPLMGIMTTIG